MSSPHPPKPPSGPLADLWDKPVHQLAQLPEPSIPPEMVERHTIFSLLVMALVWRYWNGNKRGTDGEYPWRTGQVKPGGGYLGRRLSRTAYTAFRSGVGEKPFFISETGSRDRSPSITSFLCTDAARDIFGEGNTTFTGMEHVQYPDYCPPSGTGDVAPDTLTNAKALRRAKHFYDYAVGSGKRGTPHQL
jgi:hypothetical protein